LYSSSRQNTTAASEVRSDRDGSKNFPGEFSDSRKETADLERGSAVWGSTYK